MVWKIKKTNNEIQSPSSVVRDTDGVRLKSCLKRSNPGMVSDQKAAPEEGPMSTDRRLHGSLSSGSGSNHSNGPHSRSSSTRGSAKSGRRTNSAASSKSQSSSLHSERYSTGASTGSGSSWIKAVRFNQIHIREYERTLGDNPSCSSGPPVG
jgi:hypothetical protein